MQQHEGNSQCLAGDLNTNTDHPNVSDVGCPPPLSQKQLDNLAIVMAREAAGGGHLCDRRHLGDMPDFRPHQVGSDEHITGAQQEQAVIVHGQWVD